MRVPAFCHISSLVPLGAGRWPVLCQRRNAADQAFVAKPADGDPSRCEGLRKKKNASTTFLLHIIAGSADLSQMTGVLSKKQHCGSGFCGKRLDSSRSRPGFLEDQLIIRSSHLGFEGPCRPISALGKLALMESSRAGSFGTILRRDGVCDDPNPLFDTHQAGHKFQRSTTAYLAFVSSAR